MSELEIRAAREELVRLRNELHVLGDKLDVEREARQKAIRNTNLERERERLRIRQGHRRLIAAVVVLFLAGSVSTGALAWVLNENTRERCETMNATGRGTREVVNIVYDDHAPFPGPPQTPAGVEYIEGRRAVALDRLDETQPIVDCGN